MDNIYINKYLKYKLKYINLKQIGGATSTLIMNDLYLYITNLIKQNNNSNKIIYFTVGSALPTKLNPFTSGKSEYNEITNETNQQYPFFMDTYFSNYHKIIILIDSDFEQNLTIKKFKPELIVNNDNPHILKLSMNNLDVLVLKKSFDVIDEEIFYNLSTLVISRNIECLNYKLIIHSFGGDNSLQQKYIQLLDTNIQHKNLILNNIIYDISKMNNVSCFVKDNNDRFEINELNVHIQNYNFIQFKFTKLTNLINYLNITNKNHLEVLHYYIIDFLNTLQKLNSTSPIINNHYYIIYNIKYTENNKLIDLIQKDFINLFENKCDDIIDKSIFYIGKTDESGNIKKEDRVLLQISNDFTKLFDNFDNENSNKITLKDIFIMYLNLLFTSENKEKNISLFKTTLRQYFIKKMIKI